jgi:hypothetical protein
LKVAAPAVLPRRLSGAQQLAPTSYDQIALEEVFFEEWWWFSGTAIKAYS